MKIATKIIIACTVLCSLGVAVTGGFVGMKASSLSEEALRNRAVSLLLSVREIKKNEIERYFNSIHYQLETLTTDISTQDAMVAFTQGFNEYQLIASLTLTNKRFQTIIELSLGQRTVTSMTEAVPTKSVNTISSVIKQKRCRPVTLA